MFDLAVFLVGSVVLVLASMAAMTGLAVALVKGVEALSNHIKK